MEEGLVADGTIAQDSAQVAGIWALREGVSVALKHAGAPIAQAHPGAAAGGLRGDAVQALGAAE